MAQKVPTEREDEDGDRRGAEAWKEHTKGIERVIQVVLTLDEPKTAGWVSEEALVSERPTREHLEMLADLGVVASLKTHGVTKYSPDHAFLRFRDISQLVERHDRDTLMEEVEGHKAKIESIKEDHDVETPDELRARVVDDDVAAEEVSYYKQLASEWETLQHELSLYKEALERYDLHSTSIHEVSP